MVGEIWGTGAKLLDRLAWRPEHFDNARVSTVIRHRELMDRLESKTNVVPHDLLAQRITEATLAHWDDYETVRRQELRQVVHQCPRFGKVIQYLVENGEIELLISLETARVCRKEARVSVPAGVGVRDCCRRDIDANVTAVAERPQDGMQNALPAPDIQYARVRAQVATVARDYVVVRRFDKVPEPIPLAARVFVVPMRLTDRGAMQGQ
jgi:hypothetical protein